MGRYDICAIGHITKDRITGADGRKRKAMGGAVFYAGVALQSLGLRTLVISAAAQRDIPKFQAALAKHGVDLQCGPSPRTTVFENIYDGGTGRRIQRIEATARPLELSDLNDVDADIFHLGPLSADEVPLACFDALAGRGGRVSLDVQGFVRDASNGAVEIVDWPGKTSALKYVQILKANRWEAAALAGTDDAACAARRIARMGPSEVIVTLAGRGAVLCSGGTVIDIPVTPVTDIHDPTGCGDSFCAGYLFARHQGRSCIDAARFASALAALKLQHNGPFTGTAADVEAMMGP